ncbi:succinylglutamate desuccinylase [Vogesella sp. GCM10023246]|uniref:Succinylglutamate desuccinylase n=1 Tax=Vogesella oryzagri TaxID=3160864 RepID=A0ABV1M2B0_9NEIS
MNPFAPARDFLDLTLQGLSPAHAQWQTPALQAHWLGHGLLELTPHAANLQQEHILLSTGVHGNETAPIEILNSIVGDLLSGALPLACRILVVLGNIPAMQSGKRFVDYDMNRLFDGAHAKQPEAQEARRAVELEQAASAFFAVTPATTPRRHYDLHTAIRGSVFERFAIYPFIHDRAHNREQLAWLLGADVDTVLLHSKPAATYSYYTSERCGADAFTLELGKARPFGQNDLSRFAGIDRALRELLAGQCAVAANPDISAVRLFKAKYDIVKHSGDFVLHLADDVENFTALPHGMTIAEDVEVRYVADGGEERILFPNPKVGIGLRAGIVIEPATLD